MQIPMVTLLEMSKKPTVLFHEKNCLFLTLQNSTRKIWKLRWMRKPKPWRRRKRRPTNCCTLSYQSTILVLNSAPVFVMNLTNLYLPRLLSALQTDSGTTETRRTRFTGALRQRDNILWRYRRVHYLVRVQFAHGDCHPDERSLLAGIFPIDLIGFYTRTVEPLTSSSSRDPICIHLRYIARWTTWFDPPRCGRKKMRRDKCTHASSEKLKENTRSSCSVAQVNKSWITWWRTYEKFYCVHHFAQYVCSFPFFPFVK